jgi:drug/metabolite transporter (DMT)-like permease
MKSPSAVTGYIVVIIAALAFAGNNVFAVLSYEGGTTPLTLITFRMVFTLIALIILMKVTHVAIPLPSRERNAAFGLGMLNGVMAFCLMSAFDHIDVGLAILVFYLYPVFTGLGAWLTRQETLNRGIIIGLVGSFGGLALALEVTGEVGNIQGIALAGGAAILMTCVILLSARVLQTDNARSVTLHMHVSASLLFVVISVIAGEISLPGTTGGWVGFIGVPLFYTIAVATFFAGIAMIGGVRTSLVMNLEPVASIALGFLLLGQVLSPRQLLGAAIVIASVTTVKWLSGRRKES